MSKNENIFSFPLDVTNFDNCKSTFDKILNQFGNMVKVKFDRYLFFV